MDKNYVTGDLLFPDFWACRAEIFGEHCQTSHYCLMFGLMGAPVNAELATSAIMASLDVHELIARPSLVHLVLRDVRLARGNVFGTDTTVTLILSRFHKSFSEWRVSVVLLEAL